MNIQTEQNINALLHRKTTETDVVLKRISTKSISRLKKFESKPSTNYQNYQKKNTISIFPSYEKKTTLKSLFDDDSLKTPLSKHPYMNKMTKFNKNEFFPLEAMERKTGSNFKANKTLQTENKCDIHFMRNKNYFKRERPARHIQYENNSAILNSDRSNYKVNSMTFYDDMNNRKKNENTEKDINECADSKPTIDARNFNIKSLIKNYMSKAKTKIPKIKDQNDENIDFPDQEVNGKNKNCLGINVKSTKTNNNQPYLDIPNKRATLSNHFFQIADEICSKKITDHHFRKGLNITNLEKKTTFKERVLASMKEKKQDFNNFINDLLEVQEKKAKRMSLFDNNCLMKKKKKIEAIRNCMISTFEYLFRLQINLQDLQSKKIFSTKSFEKPFSQQFINSIKQGKIDIFKKLLHANKYLVYDFDYAYLTGLHWACRRGFGEIAIYLCKAGADVDAKDIIGRPPIFYALKKNNLDLVKILLFYKADPWSPPEIDYGKHMLENTPISRAIHKSRRLHIILKLSPPKERRFLWEREKFRILSDEIFNDVLLKKINERDVKENL